MTDYNPSEHGWIRNREIELMRLETKTETEAELKRHILELYKYILRKDFE